MQAYSNIAIGHAFKKRTEEVYFSKMSSIDNYEFFRGKYYCLNEEMKLFEITSE